MNPEMIQQAIHRAYLTVAPRKNRVRWRWKEPDTKAGDEILLQATDVYDKPLDYHLVAIVK